MPTLEKDFTIIIPTWNMRPYLQNLFDSIVKSDFSKHIAEIIFVCDKSTDGTEAVIENIMAQQKNHLPKVSMIQPKERRGLFVARYLGAKAATTPKIFFIDSRITLPAKTGERLSELTRTYPAMSANVDIDVNKNIYCLYWQRSHEAIFSRTYKANKSAFTVTKDNFSDYRIGGTCFYCSRDLFIRLSEKYMKTPLHSDDTFLMQDMVESEPITVHPDFRILWEPRNQFKVFLKHLYQRGPGFAEYHIFTKRTWLFYAILASVLGMLAWVTMIFIDPIISLKMLVAALLALIFSTVFIAQNVKEFFLLIPLHVGSILYYGFGALRGTWVIWKKRRNAVILQK